MNNADSIRHMYIMQACIFYKSSSSFKYAKISIDSDQEHKVSSSATSAASIVK